jgi:hypothetical protein
MSDRNSVYNIRSFLYRYYNTKNYIESQTIAEVLCSNFRQSIATIPRYTNDIREYYELMVSWLDRRNMLDYSRINNIAVLIEEFGLLYNNDWLPFQAERIVHRLCVILGYRPNYPRAMQYIARIKFSYRENTRGRAQVVAYYNQLYDWLVRRRIIARD